MPVAPGRIDAAQHRRAESFGESRAALRERQDINAVLPTYRIQRLCLRKLREAPTQNEIEGTPCKSRRQLGRQADVDRPAHRGRVARHGLQTIRAKLAFLVYEESDCLHHARGCHAHHCCKANAPCRRPTKVTAGVRRVQRPESCANVSVQAAKSVVTDATIFALERVGASVKRGCLRIERAHHRAQPTHLSSGHAQALYA